MLRIRALRPPCCCRRPPVHLSRSRLRSASSTTAPPTSSPSSAKRPTIEDYQAFHARRNARRNRSLLLYALSLTCLTLGLSYASVPLYRAFCSATGFAGTPFVGDAKGQGRFASDRLRPVEGDRERWITVRFNADNADTLRWKFWPCQRSVRVRPGETALAFYKARNLSDQDVLGIATYNVTPGQIAPYFAKVECFCFDEQRLAAGEEVDLPVFFFIDRDFVDDPLMRDVDDIILSYTFFKAKRNEASGQLEPDT